MKLARHLLLRIIVFVVSVPVVSQTQTISPVWLYLQEKDHSLLTGDLVEDAERLGISQRALWRRAKVLPDDRILDSRDLPVRKEYLQFFRDLGLTIRATSRWLNAVSVEASPEQLRTIKALGIVSRIDPVGNLRRPPVVLSPVLQGPFLEKQPSLLNFDYGPSAVQLSNIRVTDVHALGINGAGTIVGMIDNGFNNHRSHNALKNILILNEFDFIHRISSTQRQPWEGASQGNHGALTLSALAGFESGKLIGAAYGSSLILAKTEMDSVEVPAEEDLYVEALEWMEQLGADVVSTSLGYIDWYTYDSLNGTTAITSKVARIAASKGVLLVTAMGNEGHFRRPGLTGTMIAPADADSIISAGATFSDGEIASFSSTGPTADGRIKPEVVAQGVSVVSADGATSTEYIYASGTSLSTPLVAGVAALVLSANPQLTPMEVREALIRTAVPVDDIRDPSRSATYPNNFYGHGMVNARAAIVYHGIAMSNAPLVALLDSTLSVSVFIVSDVPLVTDSLALHVRTGSVPFQKIPLRTTTTQNLYEALIPPTMEFSSLQGYFVAYDQNGRTQKKPSNAPDSLYLFREFIAPPSSYVLLQNFPNPFNSGTTIRFESPRNEDVRLVVFDILGRRIREFSRISKIGTDQFSWDGRTEDGKPASSGVYLYQLRTPESTFVGKMILIR